MKKMLLIIVFIFISCILIQYNYLVENFENIIVTDVRPLDANIQVLFSSDAEQLRDADGFIYFKLLRSDYSSLVSKVDEYKNTVIVDTLTQLEDNINTDGHGHPVDPKNVYLIGANNIQSIPTSHNMVGIWYNIAGEFLKYIDGVIYVYSAVIQKQNIDEVDESGSTYYLEGWVRHDLRNITGSEPNIETLQQYANEYNPEDSATCLHTNSNSKIYDLTSLQDKYSHPRHDGRRALWKVTYDQEYRNGSPNWTKGIRHGIKGELGKRLERTTGPENGRIEPLFKVDHPYCGDKTKLKITAVPEIDINKVDLFFGSHSSELPQNENETKYPLPEYQAPLKSFKTIDLTIPVEMTHECAVAARRSIKRVNGNTLELYQDKRKQACELTELKKLIYTTLVEFEEVIITTPYVAESIVATSVPLQTPEPPPVPTPVPSPMPSPMPPPVPVVISPPQLVSIPSSKFNISKYIKKYANKRFKFRFR